MLLTRSRKQMKSAEFDLYAEFRLSRLLNHALSGIMSIEKLMLHSGVHFR